MVHFFTGVPLVFGMVPVSGVLPSVQSADILNHPKLFNPTYNLSHIVSTFQIPGVAFKSLPA